MFRGDYWLQSLEVKGEVSNCKYHTSGHIYFTLKDEGAGISCVMFASSRQGLNFKLEEGMKIIVKGSVDVYERDGRYQIYAKEIRKEGIGDLFKEFELLKQKLSEQGMFDEAYKRPIPKYVKRLGVVTAPTGAAVRDIIDVSKRRNPGIEIILFPALVQGDGAPESIVEGIEALQRVGVDVMIVGRGGGSIEDLWGFNSEMVAQAIFNSSVPVISAVGHETDFTIADFVSDLRAPTPSAAAELAVCDVRALLDRIDKMQSNLRANMLHNLRNKQLRLASLQEKLARLSPKAKLLEEKSRLELYKHKLSVSMNDRLNLSKQRLLRSMDKLKLLSPLERLSGGYAYVTGADGKPLSTIKSVNKDDALTIRLKDGKVSASVLHVEENDG